MENKATPLSCQSERESNLLETSKNTQELGVHTTCQAAGEA